MINIQALVITVNLLISFARTRSILSVEEYFERANRLSNCRTIEGLMIQQWSPSFCKEFHSLRSEITSIHVAYIL